MSIIMFYNNCHYLESFVIVHSLMVTLKTCWNNINHLTIYILVQSNPIRWRLVYDCVCMFISNCYLIYQSVTNNCTKYDRVQFSCSKCMNGCFTEYVYCWEKKNIYLYERQKHVEFHFSGYIFLISLLV
jgi:hypothetical protein